MKVSICIPQYNRCAELRKVLNDLLQQTYLDFELLIVDDASSEDTTEVLKEFDDHRILYIRNSMNLGLYPNFNRCLELAQGEYIAIYHNHDRYDRTIVEKSVRILDEHPEVGFVHTGTVTEMELDLQNHYFIQNLPIIMKGKEFLPHLIRCWRSPVHQPTVMARKEMIKKVGLFDDITFGSCADSPLWMMMCNYFDVGYISEPLMKITPRIQSDRYGKFDWKDIQGMARAHWLGFDLLYGNLPPNSYHKKRKHQQKLHDWYFLLWLAYVVGDRNEEQIKKAIPIFYEECSKNAQMIEKLLIWIGPSIHPILDFGRRIYREGIKFKYRIESKVSQEISQRS